MGYKAIDLSIVLLHKALSCIGGAIVITQRMLLAIARRPQDGMVIQQMIFEACGHESFMKHPSAGFSLPSACVGTFPEVLDPVAESAPVPTYCSKSPRAILSYLRYVVYA